MTESSGLASVTTMSIASLDSPKYIEVAFGSSKDHFSENFGEINDESEALLLYKRAWRPGILLAIPKQVLR